MFFYSTLSPKLNIHLTPSTTYIYTQSHDDQKKKIEHKKNGREISRYTAKLRD